MATAYQFTDPRLAKLDGFHVELDEAHERADIILDRPPYNVVSMGQRDQLRLTFETLDEDERVRVIVIRAVGQHFSSGGNIGGFMEASPEHVSKLAWNIASPARCSKPVIVANRGYCFGVGFELSLACDFRIASETAFYALPEQKLGQIPGSGGSALMSSRRVPRDSIMFSATRLTTVVSRICLDMLRSRKSRREESLDVHVPDPVVTRLELDPEAAAEQADAVTLALLVVLDALNPRSVLFQVAELRRQLEELPGGIDEGQLSQAVKATLQIHTDLQIADADAMTPERLQHLGHAIGELASLVAGEYFV